MGIAGAVFYTKEVESLCMKLSAPYESWTSVVRGGNDYHTTQFLSKFLVNLHLILSDCHFGQIVKSFK